MVRMTALEIDLLLHYYVMRIEHPSLVEDVAPAYKVAVDKFLTAKLFIYSDRHTCRFVLTEKGRVLVESILQASGKCLEEIEETVWKKTLNNITAEIHSILGQYMKDKQADIVITNLVPILHSLKDNIHG